MKKLFAILLCCSLTLTLALPASARSDSDEVWISGDELIIPSVFAKDTAWWGSAFGNVLWLSLTCRETNIILHHQAPDGFTEGDTVQAGDCKMTITVPDCSEALMDDYGTVNLGILDQMFAEIEEASDTTTAVLAVPDRETLEALQQGAFIFFGWASFDETRYHAAVTFLEADEEAITSLMRSLGVTKVNVAPKPTPASMFGDVDLDGRITAKDARLALRLSAKLESLPLSQIQLADLNYDGKITAGEARKILRVSAKLEAL